jgi:hypothetical protein
MKTKSQFLPLALTAICLAALLPAGRSQIAGYLTVPVAPGYNFVANPFDTGNNTLAGVVSPSSPALGTAVYLWNVTNQQYATPAFYSANGWSSNFNVPPGTGFVISSTSWWTLILTGNLPQGNRTNFYAGANKFSLLASYYPASETLTGPDMAFPALEGENVFLYDTTHRNFSDAFTYYMGYGWFDPTGTFDANGPVINIARSFFAQNLGANTSWVQSYVDSGSELMGLSGSKTSIQSIYATEGKVILSILNPGGITFSVQFSADRSFWTTLAANQTGTTWTGPAPSTPQGFYRLTNP